MDSRLGWFVLRYFGTCKHMKRRKRQETRRGKPTRVIDEDTLEGWPPRTVFMTCSTRSDLHHATKVQALNILAIPPATLCGAKPYAGSEMRREWHGETVANICTTCKEIAIEF